MIQGLPVGTLLLPLKACIPTASAQSPIPPVLLSAKEDEFG